ncbi:hypothetical protein [Phyllobacterium sp. P30BS-XVII]|uniref:hypothetical protein n=1 Tax=Phyllobacterium sp. P30BS-XVII TaxID=2587046 RepID=UPI0013AF9858|nr:hypothetical protein [Phyllobacterium sp. P30BS-XVII]MBA8899349.1 hypothetical protein [Phyllobacterium sp. P30BS-XVII]
MREAVLADAGQGFNGEICQIARCRVDVIEVARLVGTANPARRRRCHFGRNTNDADQHYPPTSIISKQFQI